MGIVGGIGSATPKRGGTYTTEREWSPGSSSPERTRNHTVRYMQTRHRGHLGWLHHRPTSNDHEARPLGWLWRLQQ